MSLVDPLNSPILWLVHRNTPTVVVSSIVHYFSALLICKGRAKTGPHGPLGLFVLYEIKNLRHELHSMMGKLKNASQHDNLYRNRKKNKKKCSR